MHRHKHTYINIYIRLCHAFHRPKLLSIRPYDVNASSVHLLVTEKMYGVSALHTFQNYLCAQRKSVQLLSIFRSHQTTILEMYSGTLCMSLICKLHYLLFHEITLHLEETMTAAGIFMLVML